MSTEEYVLFNFKGYGYGEQIKEVRGLYHVWKAREQVFLEIFERTETNGKA
jgi:hypothetical protein